MSSKHFPYNLGLRSAVIVVLLVGFFFVPNLSSATHIDWVSISPTSGPPGTIIEVTNVVWYFFDAYIEDVFLISIKDHPMVRTIAFPINTPGTYDIEIRQDRTACISTPYGHYPDCVEYHTFTVTAPTISNIVPSGASAGAMASISGSGYAANSNVQIKFNSILVGTITSDSSGNINGQFQVPSQSPGFFTVSTDWTGRPSSYSPPQSSFTIPDPYLQAPSSISYGDSLSVSGVDYASNSLITIFVNDVSKSTITSDSNGSFSTLITTDESPGSYTLKVIDDQGNSLTSTLTILEPTSVSASFIASPTFGDLPLTVSFTGIIQNGVSPYSYEFNPGDGGSSISGTSQSTFSFSNQYTSGGSFTATLTVTDTLGKSYLTSTSINVIEPTPVPPTPVPPAPVPPAPVPPAPVPPAPVPPAPVPTTPVASFTMYPDLQTFYVDRNNDVTVQFSGDITNYNRETPIVLEITEPDGRIDTRSSIGSKSGSFTIPLKIRDNWLLGEYTVTGIYENISLGSFKFNVARVIPKSDVSPTTELIPQTVRNVAKWWSGNQVSDMEFANNIEFMIRNDMIKIPGFEDVERGMSGIDENIRIPGWIKNLITFWADDKISDQEALNAIEFLVKDKVIDLKGERRDDALGIPTVYSLSNIRTTLSQNGLSEIDSTFLEILTTLDENNVDVGELLSSNSFLSRLYGKVQTEQISDTEGFLRLSQTIEEFVDDEKLSQSEIEYLDVMLDVF